MANISTSRNLPSSSTKSTSSIKRNNPPRLPASKNTTNQQAPKSDTVQISPGAREPESKSLPVCLDTWAAETLSPERGKGVCENPSGLDNASIRNEIAGMSAEQLAEVRNNALDAADAHEGRMFEAASGLDENSQRDLGKSMFYGMAEQQSLMRDGENAQTAEQIRSRIAKLPADSPERSDFQKGVFGWADENPFYAQRGRATAAVDWAYDNYDQNQNLATQQSIMGIATNGNDVLGHGRVAVQTIEEQLANQ